LVDNEGDRGDQGDEKNPDERVLYVFRHKTLFKRLTAGC
jgi:hypothetical protein